MECEDWLHNVVDGSPESTAIKAQISFRILCLSLLVSLIFIITTPSHLSFNVAPHHLIRRFFAFVFELYDVDFDQNSFDFIRFQMFFSVFMNQT